MRFAVVGAGIAGLACAYELQKAGHSVVVYEQADFVGGRMSSRTRNGFIFDIGADHLCEWYTEMKKYCTEFGIEWEQMRFLNYGIIKNLKIFHREDAAGFWGKMRLAAQYFLTPTVQEDFFNLSNFAAFDDETAYDFMVRRLGKQACDYLVDSFCSTYQFHRATEMSKGAVFGILHSLKTHRERWDLYRTKGGMQALPNAFASRLSVQLNTPVTAVEAAGEKVVINNAEAFDAVVMACTASVTEKVYKNPTLAQATLLQQVKYAASISVAFQVQKDRLGEESVVWVPYVESSKISGFVNEKMKGEELIQGDKALICTWLHEDFARQLISKTDAEIFALVKEELVRVCPWFSATDQLANHDLQRWPEAMPKFYAGYLRKVKDFEDKHQGGQKVFFCGDYMNSLWTEGSIRGGKRLAERITREL